MEAPDTRGAGGRAPRNRGGPTPGKIIGLVSSPLQLLSKTVKGLVSSSPNDSLNQAGAAAQRPSPPVQQRQTGPASLPKPKVEDGTNGFSFPTLAASSDSPPTNSLSRPVAPPSSAQPRTSVTVDVPAQPTQAPTSTDALLSGWSPSKLASLNFFMNGAKSGAGVLQPTAPTAVPDLSNLLKTPEAPRPYFNLTAMLRAGPGGLVSGAGGISASGAAARSSSGGGVPGPAVASRGARFNPYGRPNAPKPPRPGAATAPSLAVDGAVGHGAAASVQRETSQRLPAGEPPKPSLAVASARLPPSGPRVAPIPTGAAPRQPTAPGAVRLAPGQVAFSSGRTGTPLPKFGPSAAAGQGQHQAAAQTPGGFRPLAGAVGAKRQRDSPAVSPLMASGVRNLSEFKRRRSAVPQQPRCVLAGLSARTPREKDSARCDSDRTPGAVGSGGARPATTPAPISGGVTATELPATETARKILETLDNFKRVGDTNTPSVAAAKPGGGTAARSGPPTGSPLPGPFMPPLDRLDQNHYGGTPTPSVTTGAPGFVSGATPSPLGNTTNAGQTPGPRMVLDFKTPVASPSTRQVDGAGSDAVSANPGGSNALPLSPIGVPPPPSGVDRSPSTAFAPISAAAAEAPSWSMTAALQRTGAAATGSSPAAAGSGVATEPASTSAPQFSFTSPRAPTDPLLRLAKAACEANPTGANLPGSLGAMSFTFGASTVGVDASTSQGGMETPGAVLDVRAGSHTSEILKAAATPLPDDDDEEAEGAGTAAATPVPLTASALDERPQGLPAKLVAAGSTKRVAFAEQLDAAQADKQKAAEVSSKDGPTIASSTPMATPGGFFNSNAGSTPFRPFGADASPAPATAEKTLAAADKDEPRSSLFAFGASTVTAAAAPADGSKPTDGSKSTPIFSFSQPSAPSSFTFGTLPKPAAVDTTNITTTAAEKPVPEGSRPDAEKAAIPYQTIPSSHAAEAPAKEPAPAPVFGSFVASPAPFAAPTLVFGSTQPAASVGASAAAVPSTVAPAFGTGTQSSTPSGGAPLVFGSSSAPSASSAPTVGFGSSAPAGTFVAPASTPSAAPVLGFSFGASSSSAAASGSVAPSASPAAASASFTFGTASTGVGPSPVPAFGSPMPVSNASTIPSFGAPQPSSAPAVFGSGGFGAAAGAATSFSFGAQANSGSSGGTGTVSSMGFGVQQGTSMPTPAFSFGGATSAPSFGGNASAPSFGTAPAAAQSAFGTAAPSFGGSNPFASVAPAFAAPASQPAFGAAAAGAAPTFGAAPATSTVAPSFGGFGNGGAPATGMFAFGGAGTPSFGSSQPGAASAPAFGQAAPVLGMGAPAGSASAPTMGAFAAAPAGFGGPPAGFPAPQGFGGASPAPSMGDAAGAFSIGVGEAREGRKRVKARRHGG